MVDAVTTTGDRIRHRRRSVWIVISIILSAVLLVGGFWWHSRRPEERYRRARRALEAGDGQAVWRESRALLKTSGYEPHGRLLAGLLHVRGGRYVNALYELQFSARDDTTAVEALTVASECYYRLGQLSEAAKTARTAIARDPEALDARRWLASTYYDLGAMDHAVPQLEWISEKATDDARPEFLLGLINKDNERFGDAIIHYRESLRRDPRQVHREQLLSELAESLVKLSRFDEALEVLRESSQTAPTLTMAADCHQNLGRTDKAQELLRSARELDPTYAPACLQEGVLLLLLGRAGDALVALEEAVRLAPQNSQAHFYLSQAYGRTGEDAKSAEQLRLMQEIRAVEREFSELHSLAAQNPEDADVRYRIGVLARKLGKAELSRMWFHAALALQPDRAGALAALADSEDGR
ncbi:MAG TPA: tetratricopeptide repeat protein [Planctomycetaceae bacterium]|nr:tetratricopeptide repeat protein [Planctomycetaceae bacterium]